MKNSRLFPIALTLEPTLRLPTGEVFNAVDTDTELDDMCCHILKPAAKSAANQANGGAQAHLSTITN
jgi:hypothetical protein